MSVRSKIFYTAVMWAFLALIVLGSQNVPDNYARVAIRLVFSIMTGGVTAIISMVATEDHK